MKVELEKILDEIQKICTEVELDADLLCVQLHKWQYFGKDEVDLIVFEKINTTKLVILFKQLKCKHENVLMVLQQIWHQQSSILLFVAVQEKLKRIGNNNLIWHPAVESKVMTTSTDELEIAQQNLKDYYKRDLELIRNYWKKFDVFGNLTMDYFYNQNITIKDKNDKETMFKDFDQIFSTDCRRFIIIANSGYGKSTFVHEMAHQWVKGEHEWTKKYFFVFLIRLSEIKQHETQSLQSLLTMCFNTKEALAVSHWLEDSEHMKRCLFIIDGLDELRREFCKEINDLIFGRGIQHAHVVVTFRPSKELEKKFEEDFCNNLYIELNGFTEEGAKRQLAKFNIHPKNVINDLRDFLKVPLFNTLFCITHDKATIGCLRVCTAIEMLVNVVCSQHRKTDTNFNEIEVNELVMILGQAAQNKFSLMKGVNVEYPNVTPQHLTTAIKIGLVSKKSTKEDFVFVHQTIAEYCAAYFWVKKSSLQIRYVDCTDVYFSKPEDGNLDYTELFSCFLSHLDDEYKQDLWQNFENIVPLLDEYDRLPKCTLERNRLSLFCVPRSDQNTVMDKIEISTKTTKTNPFALFGANFKSGKKFENITKMEHLLLIGCSFNINPGEFFHSYNIKSLKLQGCLFMNWSQVGEDFKEIWKKDIVLEYLHISYCDFTVVKFLSFVVRHCTILETFKLICLFESEMKREKMIKIESGSNFNYFGEGWISELQNNEKLLHSIENFELISDDPIDLTILFKTLGKMINLKRLQLTVKERNLTKGEINSLTLSFENELKKLEYLYLNLKDEDGKKINENKFQKCQDLQALASIGDFPEKKKRKIVNFNMQSTSDPPALRMPNNGQQMPLEQQKSILQDYSTCSGTESLESSRIKSIQRCVSSLAHSHQCRNTNCRRLSCHKMKRVVQHMKKCKKRQTGPCPVCKQLIALCCFHAKNCQEQNCIVPFCPNIRQELVKQAAKQQMSSGNMPPPKSDTSDMQHIGGPGSDAPQLEQLNMRIRKVLTALKRAKTEEETQSIVKSLHKDPQLMQAFIQISNSTHLQASVDLMSQNMLSSQVPVL